MCFQAYFAWQMKLLNLGRREKKKKKKSAETEL